MALSRVLYANPALGSSSQNVPAAALVESVPFVKQHGEFCGPAALASVLQFYGEKTTQKQIADEIFLPRFRGTLNVDLLLYPRKRGYRTQAQEGELTLLRQAIASGAPVICQLRERSGFSFRDHFVVVFGYDDAAQVLRLHSGSQAGERRTYADFERAWGKAERWMLTIRPAEDRSSGPDANHSSRRKDDSD